MKPFPSGLAFGGDWLLCSEDNPVRRYTPETAVPRKRFPYFVRVSPVPTFARYTEICSWAKQRWGVPCRLHKDSLWACQYEHGAHDQGEMWAWFRNEEDMTIFALSWC